MPGAKLNPWVVTKQAIAKVIEDKKALLMAKGLIANNLQDIKKLRNDICKGFEKTEPEQPKETNYGEWVSVSERLYVGFKKPNSDNGQNDLPLEGNFSITVKVNDNVKLGADYGESITPIASQKGDGDSMFSAHEAGNAFLHLSYTDWKLYAKLGGLYQRQDIKVIGDPDKKAGDFVAGLHCNIQDELQFYAWANYRFGEFGYFNGNQKFFQHDALGVAGVSYSPVNWLKVFGGPVAGWQTEGAKYGGELGAEFLPLNGSDALAINLWSRYVRLPSDLELYEEAGQNSVQALLRFSGKPHKILNLSLSAGLDVLFDDDQKFQKAQLDLLPAAMVKVLEHKRWGINQDLYVFVAGQVGFPADKFGGPKEWNVYAGIRLGELIHKLAYTPWQPYKSGFEAPWDLSR